jgi:CHAT domain-containing protein
LGGKICGITTGKLDALRRAQLEMLRENRERYGNALPVTWGAFVLSGEWR